MTPMPVNEMEARDELHESEASPEIEDEGPLENPGAIFTWDGIWSICKKEFIQLIRDPYLVTFILALPIAQLLVTGLAIQREMQHVPTLVLNYDKRNASIELLKDFDNSRFFEIDSRYTVSSEKQMRQFIREGRYRVGIIIPPDYSERLLRGDEPADVQLVLDGTNANISKAILDGARAIMANHATEYVIKQTMTGYGGGGAPQAMPVTLNSNVLFNPELKSSKFLIPGILGIIMHMMTILLTSLSIVREREAGTLEQLMVTPLRVADLMVGKVLPYAVIGLIDMLVTLGVMVWFFDISISGNFWFLVVASTVFIVTSLGVGLLISTTCRSQTQSGQLTMGFLLPSLLLTGFVFPLEPMPWFIKIVSYAMPLTYYLEVIRGVVIKGNGVMEHGMETLILLAMAIVMMIASILRFRKQVA